MRQGCLSSAALITFGLAFSGHIGLVLRCGLVSIWPVMLSISMRLTETLIQRNGLDIQAGFSIVCTV